MECVGSVCQTLHQSCSCARCPLQCRVVGIVAKCCAFAKLYLCGVECNVVAVYVLTGQCQLCACDLLADCVCLADSHVNDHIVYHGHLAVLYAAAALYLGACDLAVLNCEDDIGCHCVSVGSCCLVEGVCAIGQVLDQSLACARCPCELAAVRVVAQLCAVSELYIADVECNIIALAVLTCQGKLSACDLVAQNVCLAYRNVCQDVVYHCYLAVLYAAAALYLGTCDLAVLNCEDDIGCHCVSVGSCCLVEGVCAVGQVLDGS